MTYLTPDAVLEIFFKSVALGYLGPDKCWVYTQRILPMGQCCWGDVSLRGVTTPMANFKKSTALANEGE